MIKFTLNATLLLLIEPFSSLSLSCLILPCSRETMNGLFQEECRCFHIKTDEPEVSMKGLRQQGTKTTWEEKWKKEFRSGAHVGEHEFTFLTPISDALQGNSKLTSPCKASQTSSNSSVLTDFDLRLWETRTNVLANPIDTSILFTFSRVTLYHPNFILCIVYLRTSEISIFLIFFDHGSEESYVFPRKNICKQNFVQFTYQFQFVHSINPLSYPT